LRGADADGLSDPYAEAREISERSPRDRREIAEISPRDRREIADGLSDPYAEARLRQQPLAAVYWTHSDCPSSAPGCSSFLLGAARQPRCCPLVDLLEETTLDLGGRGLPEASVSDFRL